MTRTRTPMVANPVQDITRHPALEALSEQAAKLQEAIRQQENLRSILGDGSVDEAVSVLSAQLKKLMSQQQPTSERPQTEETESPVTDWQIKLNTRFAYLSRTDSEAEGCPRWAKGWELDDWHKRGLVCWSDSLQKLEHIGAQETLELLESLRRDQQWQEQGLHIRIPQTVLHIPPRRRGRSRKTPPEEMAATVPLQETIYRRIDLSPETTSDLLKLLEAQETALREIAIQDADESNRALAQIFRIAAERERQIREQNEHANKPG